LAFVWINPIIANVGLDSRDGSERNLAIAKALNDCRVIDGAYAESGFGDASPPDEILCFAHGSGYEVLRIGHG